MFTFCPGNWLTATPRRSVNYNNLSIDKRNADQTVAIFFDMCAVRVFVFFSLRASVRIQFFIYVLQHVGMDLSVPLALNLLNACKYENFSPEINFVMEFYTVC